MAFDWWPTPLERRIATRYLRGQRGTRSASLQTIIAIGGIAVGVCALIVVLGVMNGLRNDLRDRILVASPHLRILTFGAGMEMPDWRNALKVIRSDPDVIAAAPEVVSQGLLRNNARYAEGVSVAGIEPLTGKDRVIGLDTMMLQGKFSLQPSSDSVDAAVLIGRHLAERLTVVPGDLMQIISPSSGRRNPLTGFMQPTIWTVEVTGVFQTGMYIYDNSFVVMSRVAAQRFAGLDTAVSAIAVRMRDPWKAASVEHRLVEHLGWPYRGETWQEQNQSLFSALELEKLAIGLGIFFIMVVAAFNIVGTLTMVVNFKTREIGILEAMGLPPQGIARIFLAQGTIIGLIGTALGTVLGLVVATVVDRTGLIRIDPSIYFIDHLPVRVEPLDVLVVIVASLAIAMLATLPPSRRAAGLTPVEAIRAE